MKDRRLTEQEKKKIKPAKQGGGLNYLGKQETVTVPKKWLSDPDHVVAELAYITPKEQKILLDANIYGSLKGKPNKGPGGIMSLQGDLGGYDASPGGPDSGGGAGGKGSGARDKQRAKDIMTGKVNVSSPTGVTEGYKGPEGVRDSFGNYVGQKFVGRGLFGLGSGYRDVYTKGPRQGQVKPGILGRVLGGIGSLITGIPFIGSALGTMYDYGKGIFNRDYFENMDDEERARIGNLQLVDGQLVDTRTLDFNPNAKISDRSFTLNDPTAITNNAQNLVTTGVQEGPFSNMLDYLETDTGTGGITQTSQFDNSPYGRINDEDMVP
jgi:hypothetical protein|tara:strand:+ start:10 stop:981 length:972 start_codon:yes stop_codon:yes gene_type:complete